MGRYLCLEPVLLVAMCFHVSRPAVTSALASPIGREAVDRHLPRPELFHLQASKVMLDETANELAPCESMKLGTQSVLMC